MGRVTLHSSFNITKMKIHEYQAKQVLSRYGVPVPRGKVAESVEEAVESARELGGEICVVKAQIHAGGRGKGGGVKVCRGLDEVRESAEKILGMQLVTKQTGPKGQKVLRLLVEEGMEIVKELYCSVLVDRTRQSVVVLASTEGGMDIEEVAASTPEKILKTFADPSLGLLPYQATELAYGLGIDKLNPKLIRQTAKTFSSLYQTFVQEDCTLVEINPLVLTSDDRVVALDAKLSFDDNALFRHSESMKMRDPAEEDPLEAEAGEYGLNYIKLDGSIGCMVNGAGLAMGTMDIIKTFGGEPANFLDVGGTATEETVEKGFQIISQDPNVRCILINIFGGIVRCDMVATGIVEAFRKVNLQIPVVVRLEGTNAEEAQKIIGSSGFGEQLQMADGLGEAAKMAVASLG